MIKSIKNKKILVDHLGFSLKRNEFDKHFINFVGVLNDRLPLNSQAKFIVEFAGKFSISMVNRYVSLLVNNLNTLADCFEKDQFDLSLKLNTRQLKVLFSYLSFNDFEESMFHEVFYVLNYIEKCLKSGQREKVEKIIYIQEQTRGFDDVFVSASEFSFLLKSREVV